jgi:hypothetical protein
LEADVGQVDVLEREDLEAEFVLMTTEPWLLQLRPQSIHGKGEIPVLVLVIEATP